MICFEVTLNEKHLTTAGLPGYAVMSTLISWVRSKYRSGSASKPYEELSLHVGGLDSNEPPGVTTNWIGSRPLRVGDTICIRVAEQETADPPVHRRPSRPWTKERHEEHLRKNIDALTDELNVVVATSDEEWERKRRAKQKRRRLHAAKKAKKQKRERNDSPASARKSARKRTR
jgi:hypothetical protein